MARHADAKVILVADIDRGGVFASAYGSIMLQTPEDKERIKGIIVNKFRGDLRLFEKGKQMLEEICGVPVLGVVPMFKDILIDQEDSQCLPAAQAGKAQQGKDGMAQVAVVLLRHISNFTDFNILERDERVNLYYTNNPKDIETADIIIVPGTKATLDDMMELRRNGMAQAILNAHHDGKTVIGICGGYQMLGQLVTDPDGVEGGIAQLPGLGLLNITTQMTADKTTQQVEFTFDGKQCIGYEIHQGRSVAVSASNDASGTDDEQLPQVVMQGNCIGTYIHGFLDNKPVIDYILRDKCQAKASRGDATDLQQFRDQQYDLLADHVRRYIDIDKLYEIMKCPEA